jgi:hypothetical protein
MSYNPNIPVDNDSPANQVTKIQTNFSSFNTIFGTEHGDLTIADQGKHEAIKLKLQISDPGVTNDYDVIYSKNTTSTAFGITPQLFLQIPEFIANVINSPMQLTYNAVNTAGPQYQSFLPGGYVLYFENITGVAPSAANLVFNITLSPTPTSIVCPIAYTNSMTTVGTPIPCAIMVSNVLASTFDITMQSPGAGQNYSLTWLAIAKQ